ncbi:hypothetical protein SDC9_199533 [bioreactor metagenome]|uniref:Uncharacterized protein n=1 Tax=bioreactor metagenome TaxID=1076179 RepID=A0A645IXG2_9ZZZZ
MQKGYSSALFIPFSKYVNASRSDYYKAYSRAEENAAVSGVTDITPFIAYFIQRVYNQLAQTESEITVSAIYEDTLHDGNRNKYQVASHTDAAKGVVKRDSLLS